MAKQQHVRLGNLLIDQGLISQEQLQGVLVAQRTTKKRIGQLLIEMGLLIEERLLEVLSKQFALEVLPADIFEMLSPETVKLIPETLARNYSVIAVGLHDRTLDVATADPVNVVALDDLAHATGLRIHFKLASLITIKKAIDRYYSQVSMHQNLEEIAQKDVSISISSSNFSEEAVDLAELKQQADLPPVVKLINHLLYQAVTERASDIHIEPYEENTKVRFRIDGVLYDFTQVPRQLHLAVVSRIKIVANMDIAERRLPQDGGFKVNSGGQEYDFRVSTLPAIYGENVEIRLLAKEAVTTQYTLESLGFEPEQLKIFKQAIHRPWGMILITGPTGSGKSTTLHTALKIIRSPRNNIVTVEDPVEYHQPGIQQVQVKPSIGLDFAAALRSILRQDPDIIMVGEIRDLETAQMALRAALTGHLIFSTLHTSDAVSTIVRLIDIGIEAHLVAAALRLAAAQRLVRKICLKCKEPYDCPPSEQHLFDFLPAPPSTLYRGRGCVSCRNTGYAGRIAVFEVFPITTKVRQMITEETNLDTLRACKLEQGMDSLRRSGLNKAAAGVTTVEEVLATCIEEDQDA
ncbi:MAG: Flp pilus assembly complex ATPase component TadA [Deltaproteobacteria bacterium]|nr:Flp pilus assembly complex ATPase component TadA [Deltaproteobacteria bacterium]